MYLFCTKAVCQIVKQEIVLDSGISLGGPVNEKSIKLTSALKFILFVCFGFRKDVFILFTSSLMTSFLLDEIMM